MLRAVTGVLIVISKLTFAVALNGAVLAGRRRFVLCSVGF